MIPTEALPSILRPIDALRGARDLLPRGGLSCPDFAGKPLYYKGPRVTEARFGYQIAELTWLGMAEEPWSTPPVTFLGANHWR
jgi:hypothetical protein